MSIWGPGPFENDDGADWFAELLDKPRVELIRDALEEVSDPTHAGFIDLVDCCEAVAAAEVLVELLDTSTKEPELPEEEAEYLKAELQAESPPARHGLVEHALTAVELVVNDEENSELRQIREDDAEGLAQWIAAMKDLQTRLLAVADNTK
jgi:hypothetical protein